MLDKIFNLDNPLLRFIGKLVDAILLNFVWLVCSLPIITIGPATTALYYALMRCASDEEAHVYRAFFRSFKQNFKQGTLLGLIYIIFAVMLGAAAWAYGYIERTYAFWNVMKGAAIITAIVYAFTSQYAFAVLANFHTTVSKCIQTAFFLSIKNFGWTIVMLILPVAEAALLYFYFFECAWIIFLGMGLIVYIDSYILNRIFKPWFDEAKASERDTDPDNWTMPDEVPEDLVIPDDNSVAPPREIEMAEEAGETEETEDPEETEEAEECKAESGAEAEE